MALHVTVVTQAYLERSHLLSCPYAGVAAALTAADIATLRRCLPAGAIDYIEYDHEVCVLQTAKGQISRL